MVLPIHIFFLWKKKQINIIIIIYLVISHITTDGQVVVVVVLVLVVVGASFVDPVRGGVPEVWSKFVEEKEKVVSAISRIFILPEVLIEEKVVWEGVEPGDVLI